MKYYNLNQLRDSRLFFDKKQSKAIYILILIIIILFIFVFIFSIFCKRNYIVRVKGGITTSDNRYISSNVSGSVISIYANEGDYLKAGTKILEVSNGQENLQVEALKPQLLEAYEQQRAMDLYQKSLYDKQNYMRNEGIEQEYYGYVEYYLHQVNGEIYTLNVDETNLQKKKERMAKLESEIIDLQNKRATIAVPEVDEKKISEIEINNSELENELKKLKLQVDSETDTERYEKIREKILEIKYKIESNANILENLKSVRGKKAEIQVSLDKLQLQIEQKNNELSSITEEVKRDEVTFNNPTKQSDQILSQLITELGKSRKLLETKITELKANINLYNNQAKIFTIYAENDGYIHYMIPIKLGISIQNNQIIAEVSNNFPKDFIVEMYISSNEISKVNEGNKVKVAIEGINTAKYGTITGKIYSIDKGTVSQEIGGNTYVFYKAYAELDDVELKFKNEIINLKKSMPVEVRIIYDNDTYMDWFLNLLNFKN